MVYRPIAPGEEVDNPSRLEWRKGMAGQLFYVVNSVFEGSVTQHDAGIVSYLFNGSDDGISDLEITPKDDLAFGDEASACRALDIAARALNFH